jgi:hypothetical protein
VGGHTTNLPFSKKDASGNMDSATDHNEEYNADDRDAWWVKWILESLRVSYL